jgi:hypothetical protein
MLEEDIVWLHGAGFVGLSRWADLAYPVSKSSVGPYAWGVGCGYRKLILVGPGVIYQYMCQTKHRPFSQMCCIRKL